MSFMTHNEYYQNTYNRNARRNSRAIAGWTLATVAILAIAGTYAARSYLGITQNPVAQNQNNLNVVPTSDNQINTSSNLTERGIDLRITMRRLWADHIVWMRQNMVSILAGLADTTSISNRLMRNQEDIGNLIGQYYSGGDIGARLTNLLKEHVSIVGDIVRAARANNSVARQSAEANVDRNAEDIADTLVSANTSWSRDEIYTMLREHNRLLNESITARIQRNYDQDIALADQSFEQAMSLADMLSQRLNAQFPNGGGSTTVPTSNIAPVSPNTNTSPTPTPLNNSSNNQPPASPNTSSPVPPSNNFNY